MTDPRLSLWADTLATYCLDAQPGQQILIRADEAALPLAREAYRALLQTGAHPHIDVVIDGLDETFFTHASDEQLDFASPIARHEYATIDALCAITAPTNTAHLSGIDPAKQARAQRARAVARHALFHREGPPARWVVTQYPTPAAAQNAGLSLSQYEQFVFGAMFLETPDPAQSWRDFSRVQQKYVAYLNSVKTLRFVARDTDLTLSVAGRVWINSDGHRNFPSGEVFTGPVEDSAEGHVRFSFPSAHLGHEADDVRLTFKAGRVVEASASRGQSFLDAMLDTDSGARFLGEVAIGTNYHVQRYTRSTLYDEKIGGTFHLALGSAYPETGGVNSSTLHWDMVCDMRPPAGGGAVYADDVLIHADGQWVI